MPVRSSVLYSVKFMRRANVRKKSRKRERIRPLTSSSLISREEKEVKVVILSGRLFFFFFRRRARVKEKEWKR